MASSILQRAQPLLAGLAVLAVVLPGLGSAGLLDPWEMDRAAVARTMAGSRQVVSTLSTDADATLLTALGEHFTVRTTTGGLSLAAGELSHRVVHALVVDMAGGFGVDEPAAMLDNRVTELDRIIDGSPGLAVVMVAEEAASTVQTRLDRARARTFHRSMQGGFWREMLPDEKQANELAALMHREVAVVGIAALPDWLRTYTPSPWMLPQHRKDRAAAPVQVLDAWLVGCSLSLFGASEFSVRFPGALMLALMAMLLFIGLHRHAGTEAAWLGVLVLVSLPMAVGGARVLTFASTPPLGLLMVTLALQRLGLGEKALLTRIATLLGMSLGLVVLLLGAGLGGLAMGAGAAVVFAVMRGRSAAAWSGAALGVAAFAIAAMWVLGDEVSPLLRALRFTRIPFASGLPDEDRDLSVIIGQIGFGLHPWGGLFLLGAGRVLFAPDEEDPDGSAAAWLIAFAAGLLTTALLMPAFGHVTAPVAPFAAALTALLLVDIRRGRVRGALLSLFVVLSVLLLHRETGKDAGTLVRFFAWDPPFGGEHATFQWPEELTMPRLARALGLLGVAGCALTLARPVALFRKLVLRLDGAFATAWLVGGLLVVWALDVLISMGIRLDVLLRAEAARTGYSYDRIWLTIQSIRPEVIVGAVAFVAALIGVVVAGLPTQHRAFAVLARLRPLARTPVALALLALSAVGALIAGLMVHVAVVDEGIGAAVVTGLMRPVFFLPAAVALIAAIWRSLALARGVEGPTVAAVVGAGLIALGGVGAGASQVAGTWSYGFLIACWGVAVGTLALAAGAASGRRGIARAAVAIAAVTAGGLIIIMAERLLGLTANGSSAVARIMLASPDTTLLLVLAVGAGLNHLATRRTALQTWRGRILTLAGWAERPLAGVIAASVGAAVLAGGYAYGLLPDMSVHFSQKHLLAAITDAGGGDAASAFSDEAGQPLAFKHPGAAGSKVLGSNFYTAALPTIAARDEALAVLAGTAQTLHLTDWGEAARSAEVEAKGGKRFVIVPKSEFSAFNFAFRDKNDGKSVKVLDDSSSRLVLAASELPDGVKSRNWLDDAIVDRAAFAKMSDVHKMTADFDGKLNLIGWRLGEASVRRSQKYHLELFFEVKGRVDNSNKLFMHPHPLHRDLWPFAVVPDTEAEAKRCTGCFQTNHWRVGDIVRFDIDQEVPLGTSAGPQDIILGWYDPLSDKRLPLGDVHGQDVIRHNDNRVTIGRLLVR